LLLREEQTYGSAGFREMGEVSNDSKGHLENLLVGLTPVARANELEDDGDDFVVDQLLTANLREPCCCF